VWILDPSFEIKFRFDEQKKAKQKRRPLSCVEGWVLKSNFFIIFFCGWTKKVRIQKTIYVGDKVIARGFPLSIGRASVAG